MSMDTKQKLANTHEMYLPKIIELLDMGETSLQKVKTMFFYFSMRKTFMTILHEKNHLIYSLFV